MFRAVIFDIDGTLIDSVDAHAQSWVDAFAHFGKNVAFADVRKQIGKGSDQLLPVFLSEDEISRFGKPLDEWRAAHLKREYMPDFKPFPRVRELIETLIHSGRNVALASSAKEDELKTYKEIAGIADLIPESKQTSSDDAEKSKPHPDIFEAAMRKLDGIPVEQVVVVGDTPYDAEAAGKLGLKTIGVLSGGFPEAELQRAGCFIVYRDVAELLDKVAL